MKEIFSSERLTFRKFESSDAGRIKELCDNEHIYKSLRGMKNPYTLEMAESFIEKSEIKWQEDKHKNFAICLKSNGLVIGTISLTYNRAEQNGEIGYWLGYDYWNKGYMTEACKEIIKLGFEELNLHKLFIKAYTTNPASSKIAQKCGFEYEGCQKELIFHEGKYESVEFYGLINPKHKN